MHRVAEDTFLKCPYDPNHIMKSFRLASHIVKCQKRHPEMKLEKCPYNWTHRYTEEDMPAHLEVCNDKKLVDMSRMEIKLPDESSVSHEDSYLSDEDVEDLSSYVIEPPKPRTSKAAAKEESSDKDYGWICYEKCVDGLNMSGISLFDNEELSKSDLKTDEELLPLPIPKTKSMAFRWKTCSSSSKDNVN